jgi:hypothetical protein
MLSRIDGDQYRALLIGRQQAGFYRIAIVLLLRQV